MDPPGHLEFHSRKIEGSVLEIIIEGRLDSFTTSTIWRRASDTVASAKVPTVLFDASRLDYCDGSGVALLVQMRDQQLRSGGYFDIRGLQPELQALVEDWQSGDLAAAGQHGEQATSLVEEIGRSIVEICHDIYSLVMFVGELAVALRPCRCQAASRSLARHRAYCRVGGGQRLADCRVDRISHGPDYGLSGSDPVGPVRRADLCREFNRACDPARTRAVDDSHRPGRPLGVGICRGVRER